MKIFTFFIDFARQKSILKLYTIIEIVWNIEVNYGYY